VLDAFSTEIFPVYLENGTDPVNTKHPVARVSQHQPELLDKRRTMNDDGGGTSIIDGPVCPRYSC